MTSSTQTVYLVTGANRGIGKGLVADLLLRPDTLVIATVRDVSQPDAKKLSDLPKGNGSNSKLIEMDVSKSDTIGQAIKNSKVDKIDVVISNAGVARITKSIADMPAQEVLDHFTINTIGPLALYQAAKSLLGKSSNPKILFMTSIAASIGIQASLPFNGTPYNVSKTSLNIIGSRLAIEEKGNLIVLLVHPGTVKTDMLDHFIDSGVNMGPMQSIQECTENILKLLLKATYEDSGRFINAATGDDIPF